MNTKTPAIEDSEDTGPSDEEIDEMEIEKQVSAFYEEPTTDALGCEGERDED